MTHADFVHLRVHSAYSLLEGALPIKDLARLCKANAMPAVAVTDTGNLFGALEFTKTMKDFGVQPIIGCTLAVARARDSQTDRPLIDSIVVLVKNETGYGNLLKLTSKSFLEVEAGDPPHISMDDLAAHAEGLIALTGGTSGPVGRLILDGQLDAARDVLLALKHMFGDRLYVELQRHGLDEEAQCENAFVAMAYDYDLPLVATNQAYFEAAKHFEAHDALLCIADGSYVGEANRRRVTPDHRFKTAAEMRALFDDLPEAIDNTLAIARRCATAAPMRAPILPRFTTGDGAGEAEMLREKAREGLRKRLEAHVFTEKMNEAARREAARPYEERLDYELGVIIEMKFPGYFLIVADFIQWAKENGVPVGPGRGSGAASVVAWALTITDLDPLRFNLVFERFLNPERISMPDFDIDFCQDKRDRVIRYVQQKYGHDQVAQIITFGTLQARAALRDVGRVLQMPYGQVDRLCKMVPNNPANPVSLAEAIAGEPRLREERDADENVARLLDIANALEGLYRHASTHAAGVVIGDRPLDQLVPLYRDPRSDMPVTQFSMKWVETAGLVKFDFLGLKTLTVLDRACDLIQQRGVEIALSALPLDDAPTFAMLSRAETVGVFQFESAGMRDALSKLKPDKFEDLIALVALYRPGPMDNIPSFIRRKHGQEKPDYLHEWLKPVLTETYGVIIYQEQVLQIAQILGGYSLGQADILRRAMGKKIAAEMAAERDRFVSGAKGKGVDEAQASMIFDLVAKFAGYGFNKAHAAAYALVAYQTAYLKAHYPVEFMAASMTLDISNTDKLGQFRQELDRLGVPVLPPDVNRSAPEFAVEIVREEEREVYAVRYALGAIRNVGRQAMENLVEERRKGGRFKDLSDFAHRVSARAVNKRQLENLALAGAFDALDPNRARVFGGVEAILRVASACESDRETKQVNLFGDQPGNGHAMQIPDVRSFAQLEKLAREFEAIGFYLSAHPLDAYGSALASQGVARFQDLAAKLTGEVVRTRLAGTVTRYQERKSAKGTPFAYVTLSDPSGEFEAVAFSEILAMSRDLFKVGGSIVIGVDARLEGETPRFTIQSVSTVDATVARAAMGLSIVMRDPSALPELRHRLDEGRRGKGKVKLVLVLDEGQREVEISLPGGYTVSPQLIDAIRDIEGVVDARDASDSDDKPRQTLH